MYRSTFLAAGSILLLIGLHQACAAMKTAEWPFEIGGDTCVSNEKKADKTKCIKTDECGWNGSTCGCKGGKFLGKDDCKTDGGVCKKPNFPATLVCKNGKRAYVWYAAGDMATRDNVPAGAGVGYTYAARQSAGSGCTMTTTKGTNGIDLYVKGSSQMSFPTCTGVADYLPPFNVFYSDKSCTQMAQNNTDSTNTGFCARSNSLPSKGEKMASACSFYGCAAAGCQLGKPTCEAGLDESAGTCKFANNKCACPSTHEFATFGCHGGKQVELRYPTLAACTARGTTKLIYSKSDQRKEECDSIDEQSQAGNSSSPKFKSKKKYVCTGVKDFGKVEEQRWFASKSGDKCPTGKPDKIIGTMERDVESVCRCVAKRLACTTKRMGAVTCDGNGGYSYKTYAKDDIQCAKSLSTETKTATASSPFVVDQMKDGKKDVTIKYGAGCYQTLNSDGEDYFFDITCKGVKKGADPSFKYQKGLTPKPGKCTTVHSGFKPASCQCMKAAAKAPAKSPTTKPKPQAKETDAVTTSVTLKGIAKTDFNKTAQDNFKDVVAAGTGKICGAKGDAACTRKDVTIKIASRRAASVKLSVTIKTSSVARAKAGATTLGAFLKGANFKKNLVAKGGALAKVTGTTVDKAPTATKLKVVAASGARTALPAAASTLAVLAALSFAF
jgi:hypothetical protein